MAAVGRPPGGGQARRAADMARGIVPESPRRREVLLTAAELFATRGYAATTVRDIADAAGIRPSGLYHHFPSKEAIANEILTTFSASLVREYEEVLDKHPDPVDALREMIVVAYRSIAVHREAIALIQHDWAHFDRDPTFDHLRRETKRVERLWVELIERGVREGRIRDDIEPRLLYSFVRDTVWSTVRWFRADGPQSIDEIADAFVRVYLDGVLRSAS